MERRNLIGSRLRQARLAERPKASQGVTLSANSIGKIEMGARPVTDIQLVALAKALKVSPAWLLGSDEAET